MRPHVIEYLKTHTFRQLEEEHGVNSRPNSTIDKFALNYDQIMAKSSDSLACQCRGLVIRPLTQFPAEGWEDVVVGEAQVLAWPMNRFFNLGDPNAACVDWNDPSLRVLDKADGTCCTVYWDGLYQRWHCATRSVSEADLPIKKGHLAIGDMTFSELFFQTFNTTWHRNTPDYLKNVNPINDLRHDWTYVFELTSPYNKIVVKYDEPGIFLLAIRNKNTGEEINVDGPIKEEIQGLPWVPRPKSWDIHEPTNLIKFLNLQDPTKVEGAVVVDSNFDRVKIKSEAYLLAFRMTDMIRLSRRSVLEAVLAGHMDDVLPHLSLDLVAQVNDLQDRVRNYFKLVDDNFHTWKIQAAGDRKAFALLVQQHGDWHVPYYSMLKSSYVSVAEWATEAVKANKLSQTTLEYLVNKLEWKPSIE